MLCKIRHMRKGATFTFRTLAAVALAGGSAICSAAQLPRQAIAPSTSPPIVEFAVQYEFKVHLSEGQGLARSLLDVGVDSNDAALAARLAAGHLGAGAGGCDVKISVSKMAQGSGLRLVRATLLTLADQTVIERRDGELTIASQVAAHGSRRLV